MKLVMLRRDRSIQFLMDSPVKPWNDDFKYLIVEVIISIITKSGRKREVCILRSALSHVQTSRYRHTRP